MAQEVDVLFLHDSEASEDSFSGFSEPDIPKKKNSNKVKSTVKKVNGRKKSSMPLSLDRQASTCSNGRQSSDRPLLDIQNLSEKDISSLRSILGVGTSDTPTIPTRTQTFDSHENEWQYEGTSVLDRAYRDNVRVEINADDISDTEGAGPVDSCVLENIDFSAALFGDENNNNAPEEVEWLLPKLKAPDKGKPVSNSLAKLINLACTAPCDTESLLGKYKIPENCDRASPPLINQEIWKTLDRKGHLNDKLMVDIQNLVTTGFAPVIQLAELMKGRITSESKTLISDILTILGQIQYNLAIRRRYMIRPCLKKKYSGLCQVSMPITTKLFGDDVSKEVKNCETVSFLGKDSASYSYGQRGTFNRGRTFGRYPRRGFGAGYSNSYNHYPSGPRYQPYPQRGQQGFYRQSTGYTRPRPPKRAPTAATTAPNGQD